MKRWILWYHALWFFAFSMVSPWNRPCEGGDCAVQAKIRNLFGAVRGIYLLLSIPLDEISPCRETWYHWSDRPHLSQSNNKCMREIDRANHQRARGWYWSLLTLRNMIQLHVGDSILAYLLVCRYIVGPGEHELSTWRGPCFSFTSGCVAARSLVVKQSLAGLGYLVAASRVQTYCSLWITLFRIVQLQGYPHTLRDTTCTSHMDLSPPERMLNVFAMYAI